MTALPLRLQLDVGLVATWVWATRHVDGEAPVRGSMPAGLLLDHGDHTCLVSWVKIDDAHACFSLDSLVPLTVVEPVSCTICGAVGRIEQGAWLPAEGGAGRG